MIAPKYLKELIFASCFPNNVYLNYHLSAAINHDFALTLVHTIFIAFCELYYVIETKHDIYVMLADLVLAFFGNAFDHCSGQF